MKRESGQGYCNSRAHHKEAARTLGPHRLCTAPHTQCHGSSQCPAPVGTPGEPQGSGVRPHSGTGDSSVAHKGSAKGAWNPGGPHSQAWCMHPSQRMLLQLPGGAQHRTDVVKLLAVSHQAERPSPTAAGAPCTAPAARGSSGSSSSGECWGLLLTDSQSSTRHGAGGM